MNFPPRSSGPTAAQLRDALLIERREVETRKVSDRWHPSSIGHCLRKQFLERAGVPPTRIPELPDLRRFDGGNVYHRQARDNFDELGLRIKPEWGTKCLGCGHTIGEEGHGAEEFHLVSDELQLSGWVDLLTDHQYAETDDPVLSEIRKRVQDRFGDPVPTVFEVKSVKPEAIHNASKRGPSEHQLMQLAAVFLLYESHNEQLPVYPIRWELLLVPMSEDRFQGRFPSWVTFPLTDRVIEKTRTVLKDLNDAWDGDTLPDCTCSGPWAREITNRNGSKVGPFCVYAAPDGGECCAVRVGVAA